MIPIAILGVALPLTYYLSKKYLRKRLRTIIKQIETYNSPNSVVIQVKTPEILEEIINLAEKFKILAIDSEWVQNGESEIALLQVSFPNGKCFLIDFRQKLSSKFLEMLQNEEILKIGIGILDADVKKFREMWSIEPRGLVELKYLVSKFHPEVDKLGAKNLALKFLNVKLDKHWKISASNWEAEILSQRQIEYASNDVLTIMAITLLIVMDNYDTLIGFNELLEKTWKLCNDFAEIPFNKKYKHLTHLTLNHVKNSKNGTKHIINKNLKTEKAHKHATLKKPLYDNAKLEAPDGQLLCVCSSGKAMW